MISSFIGIGLLLGIIWLSILTYFFLRLSKHYNSLLDGQNKKTLQGILDNLLEKVHETKKELQNLIARCDKIEKEGRVHIQKIGLLRFNPFKDTGGNQSFILSLVDANNTGVVISGLYSRSGTRWYAKQVINGVGSEHELSEEEKKALKVATSSQ